MTNIRVGDIVELTEPVTPVKRVGYRLHWTEVEITSKDLLEIYKAASGLTTKPKQLLEQALMREEVVRQGFGGRERVIVRDTEEKPLPPGKYKVISKRTKLLGEYHPPSYGQDGWSGGYWCDPGYLSDIKAVHLLDVECTNSKSFFAPSGVIAHTDCREVNK